MAIFLIVGFDGAFLYQFAYIGSDVWIGGADSPIVIPSKDFRVLNISLTKI